VRINRPAPGFPVASINRISPPNGVQARPVATPGRLAQPTSRKSTLSCQMAKTHSFAVTGPLYKRRGALARHTASLGPLLAELGPLVASAAADEG
jgi:hypothetical protein